MNPNSNLNSLMMMIVAEGSNTLYLPLKLESSSDSPATEDIKNLRFTF